MGRIASWLHARLVDDEADLSRDIPPGVVAAQPDNFLRHVASLAATKTGDGLLNPKLVLSHLFTLLGAPAVLVGMLVPIRESLSLLPQVFISGRIGALSRRRGLWALGAFVQGLAVGGIGVAALSLRGAWFGAVALACLAVFAVARSVCSVSYKDVLGKTVARSTRGTATGTAANVAAFATLSFGLVATFGPWRVSSALLAGVLFVSGALFVVAGLVFRTMVEEAESRERRPEGWRGLVSTFSVLREDGQLRRFVMTRGLLVSTALAPPYMVALASREAVSSFGVLGPLVIASAAAGALSGTLWGRLTDRSSRRVLVLVGALGAGSLGLTGWLAATRPEVFATVWAMPAMLFALMLAYEGVRVGRATHLVDMAPPERRADYTAVSNTLIGVFLVAGAGFGFVAQRFGEAAVLGVFAGMAGLAALTALGLRDVQTDV